jgi:hypothetical protein
MNMRGDSGHRKLRLRLVPVLLALLASTAVAAPAHAATPSCYGAAARDRTVPCSNPALRLAVQPRGSIAALMPNQPCTPISIEGDYTDRSSGPLIPCVFGASPPTSPRVVGLVGDSHAMALRAAVQGMAEQRGWIAIDLTRSGCPFSFATRELDDRKEILGCRRFNRRVVKWLGSHTYVDTIFSVGAAGGSDVRTAPGESQFAKRVEGYQQAWAALPDSVAHVIAVRDAPRMDRPQFIDSCIRRAQKAKVPPGLACAQPRETSLLRDAATVGAKRLGDRRFRAIDLSDLMCDEQRCFPVVGGVLVFKDGHHLTRAFSGTLAPMLTRRVARVLPD